MNTSISVQACLIESPTKMQITEESIKSLVKTTPLQQLKIDPREYAESLVSDIKAIRPDLRLEYVTDDYEQYMPRGIHSVADSFICTNDASSNSFHNVNYIQ